MNLALEIDALLLQKSARRLLGGISKGPALVGATVFKASGPQMVAADQFDRVPDPTTLGNTGPWHLVFQLIVPETTLTKSALGKIKLSGDIIVNPRGQ